MSLRHESCGCAVRDGRYVKRCEPHRVESEERFARWSADLRRGWFREEREANVKSATDDGSDLI